MISRLILRKGGLINVTKNDFIKGMQYLLNAYGKEMNAAQVATWYDFFRDEKLGDFKHAIKNLIVTCPFMPSIAQIKEEIAKNYVSKEKAEDKWQKVLKLIFKYGYYQSEKAMKKMDDLTSKTIKQMGGFQKVCTSSQGERLKKEFIDLYNQNLKTEIDRNRKGENQCRLDVSGAIEELVMKN